MHKRLRGASFGWLMAASLCAQAQFDEDGVRRFVIPDDDHHGIASAVVVEADGNLLVAGTTQSRQNFDTRSVRVYRFDKDGHLVGTEPLLSLGHSGAIYVEPRALLSTGDGGFYLAYSYADALQPGEGRARIVRVGGKGPFTPYLFNPSADWDQVNVLALDREGGLIAAGSSSGTPTVFRLRPDGSLDTDFGTDGFVSYAPNTHRALPTSYDALYVTSIMIGLDGRILLAGYQSSYTTQHAEMWFAWLLPDGTPDPDFNNGNPRGYYHTFGVSTTSFYNRAHAAELSPAGEIFVAGTAGASNSSTCFFAFTSEIALINYQCADMGSYDEASDVVLLPNGGVAGIGSYLTSYSYGSVAIYPHGLAYDGNTYRRFEDEDYEHFLMAATVHPQTGELISVGSGTRLIAPNTGLRSWVIARDTIAGAPDMQPTPVHREDVVGAPAGTVVQGSEVTLAGFDPLTAIPMLLQGGDALVDGVRFTGGDGPTLHFVHRDEYSEALPLRLEHVSAGSVGEQRETRAAHGGIARLNNHRMIAGATVTASLRSTAGERGEDVFADGFE